MSRVLVYGLLALALALAVRISAPDDLDAVDQAKQGLYVVDAYHEGRWLVPLEQGSIYPTKPPLMTWLSLAVAEARGGVDELAARLPSVGAALVLLLGTVHYSRRLGRKAACVAAVALASSFHVAHCAWLARTDMLLAALTTLAVARTFEVYLVQRSGKDATTTLAGAGALMGLGTIAKSPVALACPLAAIFVFLLIQGELASFTRGVGARAFAIAALVYVAVVGFWLIPALAVGGKPFFWTLWDELVGHAAGVGDYAPVSRGPWYSALESFLGHFQPWSSILVLGALHRVPPKPTDERGLAARFAVCALAGSLVFFSLLRIKRADYVLPCYPWAAVAAGLIVERWLEEGRGALVSLGFLGISFAAMAASVVLPLGLVQPSFVQFPPEWDVVADTLAWRPALIMAVSCTLALAGVLVFGGVLRRSLAALLPGMALAVTAFLAIYYLGARAAVVSERAVSVPRFCAVARTLVGRERVVFYRVPRSVAFYLERSQRIHEDPGETFAELDQGARTVITDETGLHEVLARRPELAVAAASGFFWRSGSVRQLYLLRPMARLSERGRSHGRPGVGLVVVTVVRLESADRAEGGLGLLPGDREVLARGLIVERPSGHSARRTLSGRPLTERASPSTTTKTESSRPDKSSWATEGYSSGRHARTRARTVEASS
jgi:4-amino-4-deoxy-L-arabinose transferase-like glycosyltransferase